MDNTSKFTGQATVYSKSRPKYSEEFIDFLYNNIGIKPHSIIAYIGSKREIYQLPIRLKREMKDTKIISLN